MKISLEIILDQRNGGTYSERSFLRPALFPHPFDDDEGHDANGRLLAAYGRGSGLSDQRVSVLEVGSDRTVADVAVARPVVDMWQCRGAAADGASLVAMLCESEVLLYKWHRE